MTRTIQQNLKTFQNAINYHGCMAMQVVASIATVSMGNKPLIEAHEMKVPFLVYMKRYNYFKEK